jgi:nucleoside 2-deoxyribosyltransferase
MTEKRTVYLAGGFYSGWQDAVRKALPSWRILDPSQHHLVKADEYTEWDLEAIRKSGYVLAYMERSNPGGYALALEVGYAKALHRKIIFVEEHETESRRRYFDMVRQAADLSFDTLAAALRYLQSVEGQAATRLED